MPLVHHQSVHGLLTCPSPSQPFVQAWLQAWGAHQGLTQQWRSQCSQRDRYLLGKLVIPTSLHELLKDALGPRSATKAIKRFQPSVLPLLLPLLPTF